MFGDYKSYKLYAPQYDSWKASRNLEEAKRELYLKQNLNEIKTQDIQKSKTLLRAIDVMDEYSQKRAEDMEVATQSVVSTGLQIALIAGAVLGFLVTGTKPFAKILAKYAKDGKKQERILKIITTGVGGMLGTVAAFPLYAWAAKAEVSASRKGRFEAMRKELNDPKTFAELTPEQEVQLNQNLKKLSKKKEKTSPFKSIKESWQTVKEMVTDSEEYLQQRFVFEQQLEQDSKNLNRDLTLQEIEEAKKDQQILTKLVEKIDIASQDYAENAELATSAIITLGTGFGSLLSLGYEKMAKLFKLKQSSVPAGLGMILLLGSSIFATQIQKQASRVGRFKAKQELLKHPEQLVYVSDEKTGQIKDVEIKKEEKLSMFKFLKEAWKNNKEFEKWKKTEGEKEKQYAKAISNIELSEEQVSKAKKLQHNTFKTFNKVDEYSQKYSESVEALGQAAFYPLSLLFTSIGLVLGLRYLNKATAEIMKKKSDAAVIANNYIKYFSAVFLSTLPSIGINAYLTKEQKKASRVANMLAINEMNDYKYFITSKF